jgi:LysM repeat protein
VQHTQKAKLHSPLKEGDKEMAKTYLIENGETLASIAQDKLGSAALAAAVADYNGLPDAGQIFVGQQIQLPSKRDMQPPAPARARGQARAAAAWPAPPHGFQGVRDTFGDILDYIGDDGGIASRWESERMAKAALPFPVPLSWDTAKSVTAIRCHKLIAPLLEEVFRQIAAQGLKSAVKTYGGGYVYRPKRGAVKPSTHSWGIAIDLNPNTNAMGSAGDMSPQLVALFEANGFVWGGRWSGRGKDPMHFQYCSGY